MKDSFLPYNLQPDFLQPAEIEDPTLENVYNYFEDWYRDNRKKYQDHLKSVSAEYVRTLIPESFPNARILLTTYFYHKVVVEKCIPHFLTSRGSVYLFDAQTQQTWRLKAMGNGYLRREFMSDLTVFLPSQDLEEQINRMLSLRTGELLIPICTMPQPGTHPLELTRNPYRSFEVEIMDDQLRVYRKQDDPNTSTLDFDLAFHLGSEIVG